MAVQGNYQITALSVCGTGRFRVNTHIHFYISGYVWQHYRRIWTVAEKLWIEQVDRARDCVVQDNLGADMIRRILLEGI